jgi:hypothetical protein
MDTAARQTVESGFTEKSKRKSHMPLHTIARQQMPLGKSRNYDITGNVIKDKEEILPLSPVLMKILGVPK